MEHVTVQKTSRFSKLKVGIAAVALGALLVIPSAGAQNTADMTFSVAEGTLDTTLTAEASGALVGDTPFIYPSDYAGETITGSLLLNVNDDRGSGDGWHVDLTASQFADPDTATGHAHTIPATAFWVNNAAAPTLVTGTTGTPAANINFLGTGTAVNELAAGVEVIDAPLNEGMGSYDQTIGVSLTMPDDVYAGAYSSTVTATTTPNPAPLN